MKSMTRLLIVGLMSIPSFLVMGQHISAAPSVTRLSLSADSVGRYEIIELRADVTTEATNPFWPYDPEPPPSIPPGVGVTVDGLFSDDNWNTMIIVPGFLYLDYERYGEGFVPVGRPEWRVRFAPPRTGTWRAKLRVTDASGTTTHPEGSGLTFECTASQNHGFVRVSERDPRYFELSDGTPLLSPGVNVASPRSIEDMESKLSLFGANGVRLVRWWMTYRGLPNPFGGGDVATAGGPQWTFSLSMDTGGGCKPGDRYSAKLTPGKSTYQGVYLLGGRSYRFAGYIKSISVAAPAGQGIVPYIGNQNGTPIVGSTDWTRFEMYYTPSSDGFVRLGVKHTGTEGTGYFDDVELRYTTDGGGSWSENCLVKGDFDFQNYIDLQEAYKADLIFQAAKQHGVYLKVVITEKQDKSLGCIAVDGSTVERSDNNFYASQNHPSRWLQQAWWRYLTARWGAFTSVHSWELCNEGDPFNGNHWNAASALADYVHSIDPNRHLCTTSFWHSIPMDFWKNSSCDYIDLHEYVGPKVSGTESHGPRFYAWYDPGINDNNSMLVPYVVPGRGELSFDSASAKSGKRCYRIIAYEGVTEAGNTWVEAGPYHIGIDPSHTYRLRCWAKGENISNPGGGLWWTKPRIDIVCSRAYHENDYMAGGMTVALSLGTYDWTFFESTSWTPPANANTANIYIQCTRGPTGSGNGILWVDKIEFIDEITGRNLFVDGDFEEDRIDFDTALAVEKYGVLLNSYGLRVGKPGVWGESSVREEIPSGSSARVLQDIEGVQLKKMIWAHAGPANPNMLYWDLYGYLAKNIWHHFRNFQNFISGIPVSNGNYRDVDADVSNDSIRVLGQKDTVNRRAHLWIDNRKYTWRNIVDGVNVEPVSGQVTISGLADGLYQVEWWDTSTGAVTRKEDVQCSQGKITLTVTNLVSDVACKIAPAPPALSLRLTVIEGSITPGSEVTIAVDYTNTGATEALNAAVTARVPAEMDYIEGSAEATGGSYDPVEKSVTWIVERIAAGETGRRIFKARVR